MDNLAADFIIEFNNPIEAEFELSEPEHFDCSFEVYASGTVWGSISGDINNQTDLIELIENNYNDLEGQITTLDTKVDNNYNELSNGLIEANQDILDLTNTVNSNFTTLNNKIDEINIDLSTDISELNTAIQNEVTTRAENDTLLQNNINTLSQTVTANYNTLDGKIDTEIANRTASDTTLQNNIDAEALARQNADTTLQGNIDTLSGTVTSNYNALDARITTNTGNISDINTTLSGYGNIVTHNVSEFATSAQGTLADTALQPNDNISELVNDVGYITSASLPTDYVPETRTINGYALSSNITLNYADVGALSASTTINDLTTIAQQNALNSGATITNIGQIATNTGDITAINEKIPSQASSSNQLADKDFVNSSIATNTANFIGTFNSVAELEAYSGTLTNNDYAFVATTDAAGNTLYDRYKYNADTQEWLFEYELNNSSFTAAQWASINSGATSTNIGQITTNANNIADLQTNKQDVLTAGANIQINNNVISATDTTYTAGTGISIVNGVISNTQTSAEWGNIQGTLSNQTDLQNALDDKQNTISDLSTIRSGASAGATALQPNDNITELVNNAGYITSSALNGYATEQWVTNQGYTTNIGTVTSVNNIQPDASGNVTLTIPDTATWGNITGTLSNQTDLQNALNGKANNNAVVHLTGDEIINGDKTFNTNSTTYKGGTFYKYDGEDRGSIGGGFNSLSIAAKSNRVLALFGSNLSFNSSILVNSSGLIPYARINAITDSNAGGELKYWTGTKAQYDAIATKDATTLYNIVDDTDTTLTLLELLFPVGAVYFGTMSTCPLQTLGVGTWQALPPDKVIQVAGTRGSVGDTLNESLPNIKGEIKYICATAVQTTSDNAFEFISQETGTNKNTTTGGGENMFNVAFNASRSSSTYQDNAPVQQDAYLLRGWERIS